MSISEKLDEFARIPIAQWIEELKKPENSDINEKSNLINQHIQFVAHIRNAEFTVYNYAQLEYVLNLVEEGDTTLLSKMRMDPPDPTRDLSKLSSNHQKLIVDRYHMTGRSCGKWTREMIKYDIEKYDRMCKMHEYVDYDLLEFAGKSRLIEGIGMYKILIGNHFQLNNPIRLCEVIRYITNIHKIVDEINRRKFQKIIS